MKTAEQLQGLDLSRIAGLGIKYMAALTSLESLDLRGTRATAAGVTELQEALPKCRIEWGEGASALERAK